MAEEYKPRQEVINFLRTKGRFFLAHARKTKATLSDEEFIEEIKRGTPLGKEIYRAAEKTYYKDPWNLVTEDVKKLLRVVRIEELACFVSDATRMVVEINSGATRFNESHVSSLIEKLRPYMDDVPTAYREMNTLIKIYESNTHNKYAKKA